MPGAGARDSQRPGVVLDLSMGLMVGLMVVWDATKARYRDPDCGCSDMSGKSGKRQPEDGSW